MKRAVFGSIILGVAMMAGADDSGAEIKSESKQERARAREIGVAVGILPTGQWNAITNVKGVLVGRAHPRGH